MCPVVSIGLKSVFMVNVPTLYLLLLLHNYMVFVSGVLLAGFHRWPYIMMSVHYKLSDIMT